MISINSTANNLTSLNHQLGKHVKDAKGSLSRLAAGSKYDNGPFSEAGTSSGYLTKISLDSSAEAYEISARNAEQTIGFLQHLGGVMNMAKQTATRLSNIAMNATNPLSEVGPMEVEAKKLIDNLAMLLDSAVYGRNKSFADGAYTKGGNLATDTDAVVSGSGKAKLELEVVVPNGNGANKGYDLLVLDNKVALANFKSSGAANDYNARSRSEEVAFRLQSTITPETTSSGCLKLSIGTNASGAQTEIKVVNSATGPASVTATEIVIANATTPDEFGGKLANSINTNQDLFPGVTASYNADSNVLTLHKAQKIQGAGLSNAASYEIHAKDSATPALLENFNRTFLSVSTNAGDITSKVKTVGGYKTSADLSAEETMVADRLRFHVPSDTVANPSSLPADGAKILSLNGVDFIIKNGAGTDTASKVFIDATSAETLPKVLKAIASKINDDSGAYAANLRKAGFRANFSTDQNDIVILRADTALSPKTGGDSYGVTFYSDTGATGSGFVAQGIEINSNPVQGTATQAEPLPLQISMKQMQVIELGYTTEEASVAKNIAQVVNSSRSNKLLSTDAYRILSNLQAKVPGTTTNVTLTSEAAGTNGSIIVQTAKGCLVGDQTSTTVGSLGRSNVVVAGQFKGQGTEYFSGIKQNNGATGFFTIDSSKIVEGGLFEVASQVDGAPSYRFTESPRLENDVRLVVSRDASGRAVTDLDETVKNLVKTLREDKTPLMANLAFESKAVGRAMTMSISTVVAQDAANDLRFCFKKSPIDAAPSFVSIEDGEVLGVDASHILNNPKFLGSIKKEEVSASYISKNLVKLDINFADEMFSAVVQTISVVDHDVLFVSATTGNTLSMSFKANKGMEVSDSNEAKDYALNVGNALSGLTFHQNRQITSFKPQDQILTGATAYMTSDHFSDNDRVSKVTVDGAYDDKTGAGKSYVTIDMEDGRTFKNVLRPNENLTILKGGTAIDLYRANSKSSSTIDDETSKITLYLTDTIDLLDPDQVKAFEKALNEAFQTNKQGIPVQVGTKRYLTYVPDFSPEKVTPKGYDVSTPAKAAASIEIARDMQLYADRSAAEVATEALFVRSLVEYSMNLHDTLKASSEIIGGIDAAETATEASVALIQVQTTGDAMAKMATIMEIITGLIRTIIRN